MCQHFILNCVSKTVITVNVKMCIIILLCIHVLFTHTCTCASVIAEVPSLAMEIAVSNSSNVKNQALLWKLLLATLRVLSTNPFYGYCYKQLIECEVPSLAMEIAISNSSSAKYQALLWKLL